MQSFHILPPRFIRKILMWISLRNCPPVLTRSQHGSCPIDYGWITPRPRSCGVSHHGDSIRFLLMPTDAVCIGSTDVQPVSSVHDLGVYVSCKLFDQSAHMGKCATHLPKCSTHLTNWRNWSSALRFWSNFFLNGQIRSHLKCAAHLANCAAHLAKYEFVIWLNVHRSLLIRRIFDDNLCI